MGDGLWGAEGRYRGGIGSVGRGGDFVGGRPTCARGIRLAGGNDRGCGHGATVATAFIRGGGTAPARGWLCLASSASLTPGNSSARVPPGAGAHVRAPLAREDDHHHAPRVARHGAPHARDIASSPVPARR